MWEKANSKFWEVKESESGGFWGAFDSELFYKGDDSSGFWSPGSSPVQAPSQLILIDLQSEHDDFDTQRSYWILGHKVCTDEFRLKLLAAYGKKDIVEVSLLFWEGTEFRCLARVTQVAPKFRLELIGESTVPDARRQPIDSSS